MIDKSKLVYAVGWFNAQHNLQNISKADHVIGSSPSFCQAASLAQHPGVVKHMDASGTWVFDRTDPAGAGFRVWYDDEASLGPKYAMVREAGWGGVGMWLANGARRRLPARSDAFGFGPRSAPAVLLLRQACSLAVYTSPSLACSTGTAPRRCTGCGPP